MPQERRGPVLRLLLGRQETLTFMCLDGASAAPD
jgi:hypothetical protein